MAYVYKFELDESLLEIWLHDIPHKRVGVKVIGTLRQKEDEGDWEDTILVNAELEMHPHLPDPFTIQELKDSFVLFLGAWHTRHKDDIDLLTEWLDETEFTEEELSMPDAYPEDPIPEE